MKTSALFRGGYFKERGHHQGDHLLHIEVTQLSNEECMSHYCEILPLKVGLQQVCQHMPLWPQTFPFHKTVAITPRGTSDHKSALAGAAITQTRDNTRSI